MNIGRIWNDGQGVKPPPPSANLYLQVEQYPGKACYYDAGLPVPLVDIGVLAALFPEIDFDSVYVCQLVPVSRASQGASILVTWERRPENTEVATPIVGRLSAETAEGERLELGTFQNRDWAPSVAGLGTALLDYLRVTCQQHGSPHRIAVDVFTEAEWTANGEVNPRL